LLANANAQIKQSANTTVIQQAEVA
jgi:hypothetical protein